MQKYECLQRANTQPDCRIFHVCLCAVKSCPWIEFEYHWY